jgi:hypothetical protein
VQYVWDLKKTNKKQEAMSMIFLTRYCLPYCTCLISCLVSTYVSFKVLVFIVVSWIVCRVINVLCILWSPYVYSLSVYLWCGVFVVLGVVLVVLLVLMFFL